MRKLIVLFLLPFLFVACSSLTGGSMLERELPPNRYEPPEVERWTLSNGLQVIYLENKELPFVSGTIYMRTGALWNIDEKPGIFPALGSQMRLGGAGRYSADDFEKELLKLSAGISVSFGSEYSTVSFDSLEEDASKVLELVRTVIMEPRFQSDKLALWKREQLDAIRRRQDDPFTVARISFSQLMNEGNPYGRVTMPADISAINRSVLKRAHRRYVYPNNGYLVITGSASREQVSELLENALSAWKARKDAPSFDPPFPESRAKAGIYFIRGDYQQSSVIMGHRGAVRLPDDYVGMAISNEVFGSGGFSSLLLRRIREELGLAYWASGTISHDVPVGSARIAFQTKGESTSEAIQAALGVLDELQEAEVDPAELSLAQKAVENSFVFKFDSPSSVASRFALLDILGYPGDYDSSYLDKVRALNTQGLQAVFKRYWRPEDFIIVVVGNDASYNSLESFAQWAGPELGFQEITLGEFAEKFSRIES